jgi:hypothetical protein
MSGPVVRSVDGPARESQAGCPFLGPRPYAEADAEVFFGRGIETREMLSLVFDLDWGMTVLTAESGAGKTSLLQAGVVPALRSMRAGKGPRRPGPVLYVSSGGLRQHRHTASFIAGKIQNEIATLEQRVRERPESIKGVDALKVDLERLREVKLYADPQDGFDPGSLPERDWVLGYLRGLCDAVDGGQIILILDQFEELLGSGASAFSRSHGEAVLQLIGLVMVAEPRIHFVLSLREEYFGRLRPLDNFAPALAARTRHLAPLTVAGFAQAVDALPGKPIQPDAISRVLEWVEGTNGSERPSDRSAPVDALVAQAILEDVYIDRTRRYPAEHGPIALKDLDDYASTVKPEARQDAGLDGSLAYPYADVAMYHYITRALHNPGDGCKHDGAPDALLLRMAARMGATLSSPRGFKRHVVDVQLVLDAMREDLRTPPLAGVHEHLKSRLPQLRDHGHVDDDSIPPTSELGRRLAKADLLARAAFDAIERLESDAGRVLKSHDRDSSGNRVLALVHDGFGPAFDRWGEQFRNRIDDALASVVGCYGLPIQKNARFPLPSRDGLNWVACFLDSIHFENVRFTQCDFSGSMFLNCTFKTVTFDHCTLTAAGFSGSAMEDTHFIGCTMPSVGFARCDWTTVSIEGGNASGLLIKEPCHWKGSVRFVVGPAGDDSHATRGPELTSAVIKDVRLAGRFVMKNAKLWYAQLWNFKGIDESAPPRLADVEINGCDLQGALIADYRKLEGSNLHDNDVDAVTISRAPATR